jgi:hypothetical protein
MFALHSNAYNGEKNYKTVTVDILCYSYNNITRRTGIFVIE